MMKRINLYFFILLIAVGSQISGGKFSDHVQEQECEESDLSISEDIEYYEKLYKDYISKRGFNKGGSFLKYNSLNGIFYDAFQPVWELDNPTTHENKYNISRRSTGVESLYEYISHHDGTEKKIHVQNYFTGYTLNAQPRPVNRVQEQASPALYVSEESSDSDWNSDRSEADYTDSSSTLQVFSDTASNNSLDWDSDSHSNSSRSSQSDETDSGSDSDEFEDCTDSEFSDSERSDGSDSEDRSISADCSGSEECSDFETGDSEEQSQSEEGTDSGTESDSENSDSESNSDSEETSGSDETNSETSSQSDDGDFYFEDSTTDNDRNASYKKYIQNSIALVTHRKIPRSLNIENNFQGPVDPSAFEGIPKLRLTFNMDSNATNPQPSHGTPKDIELLLDEKIEELIRTNEEDFRDTESAPQNPENMRHTLQWGGESTSPEAVELREISWNQKFFSSNRVSQWVSLNNKAAGFFQNQLTLVTGVSNGFKTSYHEVGGVISDLCLAEVWDEEEHSLLDILITAEDARVNWYHFSGDNELEQLWTWETQEPVTRAAVFRTERGLKALLVFQPNIGVGDAQLDTFSGVYGVTPWSSWWLEQRLPGGGASAVSDDGGFIALAQPDGDTIHFYTYEPLTSKYILSKVLLSASIRCLNAFTSGTDSFLAVGAEQSTLYLVKNGLPVETEVLDYHMETVDVFLPIKVDYLRNAVILLVQHNLEHGLHESIALEALSWNGQHFHVLEHAPCVTHENEPSPAHGFSCLLEAEGLDGVRGAAPITTAENVKGLLLSGEDHPPLLFDIATQIINVPNPSDASTHRTLETIRHLYEKFKLQRNILHEMKTKLQAPRRLVGRRWKVRKLSAPAVHIEGDAVNSIVIDGKKWLNAETFRNGEYQRLINFNNDHIKRIVKSLRNAVKISDFNEGLKVPIVFNQGITVHGNVSVDDAQIRTINDVNIEDVLKHTRQLAADNKLHEAHVQLENLVVNKLFVTGAINGINIFEQSHHRDPLVINANVEIVGKILNVTEDLNLCDECRLNKIDVVNDVVRIGTEIPGILKFRDLEVKKELKIKNTINNLIPSPEYLNNFRNEKLSRVTIFDSTTLESLILGGNLKVNYVNGHHWETLQKGFIYKNEPNDLEKLHIKGKIVTNGAIYISKLNSLIFPNEFVSTYEAGPILITGLKTFKSSVVAKNVKCSGTINGIRPQDMVTLETEQILGNMSFTNLIVEDSMIMGGNILGNQLENILLNPTLIDSKVINSNVIFKNLYINGTLKVMNTFNETNMNTLASEMYSNENVMVIEGEKEFGQTVNVQGLLVASNKVSDLSLDELLTTGLNNNLEASITLGQVTINKLFLNGSFAQTNFMDILNNAVYVNSKTDQQNVYGRISFWNKGENDLYEEAEANEILEVNNLIVLDKLNNLKVKNNTLKKDDVIINIKSKKVHFLNLSIRNLLVHGSLETNNKIAGVDLVEFDKTRLSKNHDQTITGNFIIKNCTSFGNVISGFINNYPSRDIIIAYNQQLNLKDDVFAGKIPINYLKVNSLTSNNINGRWCLREIAEKAINLNEENTIYSNITFLDPIELSHLEVTGYFCNEYFPNFVKSVISVHEDPIVIYGRLEYSKPPTVTGKLYTKYLNNKNMEVDILQKNQMTTVQQQVTVLGDVTVKGNLNVSGFYNNEYISDVNIKIAGDDSFIQGNVYFEDNQRINKLNINGLINDNYNFKNIINTLVWLNGSQTTKVPLDVSFTNPTIMKSGLNIKHLYNGIDLQKLLDEIIYIKSNMHLEGLVTFMEPVVFNGNLKIKKNLSTEFINNYSLKDWRENAIFKDEDSVLGKQLFKKLTIKGNVNANYINGIPLNSILTSNTDQILPNDIYVENLSIDKDITVDGLVNSVNINDVYSKTLMKYGQQSIQSPIMFKSNVLVKNVTSIQSVNGKPVQSIVAPVSYSTCNTTLNNQHFSDSISGERFHEFARSKINMNNSANMTLNVEDESLNRKSIISLRKHLFEAQRSFAAFNRYFQEKSKSVQDELRKLNEKINRGNKRFKQFLKIQVIENNNEEASNYHYMEANKSQLIFENNKNSCLTFVWRWSPEYGKFERWSTLNTGEVTKWFLIVKDEHFFFINSVLSNYCKNEYSKIWEIIDNSLKLKFTLRPLQKLLSVDYDGTMRLQNVSTGQVVGYRLMNDNDTMRLESLDHTPDNITAINENKLEHLAGSFSRKISVLIFPSKLEVNSSNGLLNVIPVSNPKNVHIIKLNEMQNMLIFSNVSKHIHVYEYMGMLGYVYGGSVAMEVDSVDPVMMYNVLGEQEPYLLVKTMRSLTLLKLNMNNVQ